MVLEAVNYLYKNVGLGFYYFPKDRRVKDSFSFFSLWNNNTTGWLLEDEIDKVATMT